jgi:hypothetical protein
MKITFTGSHSTGKTTISFMLMKEIYDQYGIEPHLLTSATRSLLNMGKGDFRHNPNTDGFQLACIFERRNWMLTHRSLEAKVVISERCALDESAYQLDRAHKIQNGGLSTGTYDLCLEEAKWEVQNYWDKIYYIPVDDREVASDGVRNTNKDFQREIDSCLLETFEILGIRDRVVEVPVDLEDVPAFLREEVSKYGLPKLI